MIWKTVALFVFRVLLALSSPEIGNAGKVLGPDKDTAFNPGGQPMMPRGMIVIPFGGGPEMHPNLPPKVPPQTPSAPEMPEVVQSPSPAVPSEPSAKLPPATFPSQMGSVPVNPLAFLLPLIMAMGGRPVPCGQAAGGGCPFKNMAGPRPVPAVASAAGSVPSPEPASGGMCPFKGMAGAEGGQGAFCPFAAMMGHNQPLASSSGTDAHRPVPRSMLPVQEPARNENLQPIRQKLSEHKQNIPFARVARFGEVYHPEAAYYYGL